VSRPDTLSVWIWPATSTQTDANPACANVTVAFTNTMATAAAGWQYWVLLEWRDAAGHDRLGSMTMGPFAAPTVAPGAVVKAPLHVCATTAPPAGKHASVVAVPMTSGP
jgi:hypothetical protein